MKFKQKYNIGKVLSLAGLMMLANACNKEPYDVIIDLDPYWTIEGMAAQKISVQEAANDKYVNTIFLNANKMSLVSWHPKGIHRARDTLQMYMDMAPGRVRGMGTMIVDSDGGAQLPDCTATDTCGMALEDSLWYTYNGWKIERYNPYSK